MKPRALATGSSRARCAYCDGPLPTRIFAGRPASEGGEGPRYCCYGCRVLGERGQRPLAAESATPGGWFRVGLGAVLAGQSMLLDLAVNLSPPQGSLRWLLHGALLISTAAVLYFLGLPLGRSVSSALRDRRLTIDFLFLAGVLGALGVSLYSTLTGRAATFYEVVAVLLTVYTAGKTLAAQSRSRALAEAKKLQTAFDQCVRFPVSPGAGLVPVDEVRRGDRIFVAAGEPIPVDGRVVKGRAFVRETPLSGEPFPVVRQEGDAVFAGSYSEDGPLVIESVRTGRSRRLDELLAMTQAAREVPSALQLEADRVTRWFLPVLMLAAILTLIGWSWGKGISAGLLNGLAVLVVACPCAMGLATPIGIWNALSLLATRGLVGRSGDFIARMAGVTHVVFDKTGTLSEERFSLIDLAANGGQEGRGRLLSLVQAIGAGSRHPIALAFARNDPRGGATPRLGGVAGPMEYRVRSHKTVPAAGVECWVENGAGAEHYVRMGGRDFAADLESEPGLLGCLGKLPGDQRIYIEIDGHLAGIAAVRERLRASSIDAMRELRGMGIGCSVMTGDGRDRAEGLGLTGIQAGLGPEQKAEAIHRLQASGQRVVFVGDGVNDAPALAAADAGIALDQGAGLATATAGAVLFGGDLRTVAWGLALCRRAREAIRSNLRFAAGYNVLGIGLAAAGWLHPVAAALLMGGSSFIVSWRALRLTQTFACCTGIENEEGRDAQEKRLAAGGERERGPGVQSPGITGRGLYGAAIVLQACFAVWFGRVGGLGAAALLLGGGGLGLAAARSRAKPGAWGRFLSMGIPMLALGNWGMLLGWWADNGFGPVQPMRGMPGHADFLLSGVHLFSMPWMVAGMLAFGLPPMLAEGRRYGIGLGAWTLGLLSATGMVVGMVYGGQLGARVAPGAGGGPFLGELLGMTLGMLAGMTFFCELGQALRLWFRAQPSRRIESLTREP